MVGIDLARGMVERARQAARKLGLDNVRVEVGNAEAPPAEPRSVDAILSSLVLFFVPNIDVALDDYARALVVGGTLAFSTFGGEDDWTPIDRLLATFTAPPPPPHEEAWFESPTGIRALPRAHRFQNISIEDVTHQVEFPDLTSFHEWGGSTGWRASWQAIPVEHWETAKAEVDDYLHSLEQRRGTLRLATAARYIRAEAT